MQGSTAASTSRVNTSEEPNDALESVSARKPRSASKRKRKGASADANVTAEPRQDVPSYAPSKGELSKYVRGKDINTNTVRIYFLITAWSSGSASICTGKEKNLAGSS